MIRAVFSVNQPLFKIDFYKEIFCHIRNSKSKQSRNQVFKQTDVRNLHNKVFVKALMEGR